jgi:excisionase family DNA binding protein
VNESIPTATASANQLSGIMPLVSVETVAAQLGLKAVTVRAWVAAGRVTFVKVGRRTVIPQAEIERIIRAGLHPARTDLPPEKERGPKRAA